MISAIFACKIREAIISLNWTACSSQMLTEQSRCRERATCALISHCCSSTNDHRDSLKFVQEVAIFVTSRFFGKKKSLGGLHCVHLYYSPLPVWLQQHTHFQTYTHVQEYLDHGQSEGVPPFTISDWFRPRYGPNVCLLLNHRETFRVTETFFLSNGWSHQCNLRFFLVAPLIN